MRVNLKKDKSLIDPDLLDFLKSQIEEFYPGEKIQIILYGSRARGDAKERSDWDFAIKSPFSNSEFILNVTDNSPTLCGVDIIDYQNASSELKANIDKEGVIVYESN